MREKILVITPAFSGGSWISVNKILEKLNYKSDIFVVGLGDVIQKNSKYSYFSIPYPRFDRWGFVSARALTLSVLWNVPLFILSIVFILLKRPKVVIANGFSPSLAFVPIISKMNIGYVVMYHGYIEGYLSAFALKFVRYLTKFVDLVVVNSIGSFNDVKNIISEKKIIVNQHYAERYFFKIPLKKDTSSKMTVLYVGRLDKEKLFYPLIQIAKRLRNNKKFEFLFVGVGELQSEIEKLDKTSININYKGYISDRKELAELYAIADVVWSFADETYLALPAVESLASGTPLIIPKYSALYQKKNKKALVMKNLVPDKVGWIVDVNDVESCFKLILSIQKNKIYKKMIYDCRRLGILRYSDKNLDKTISSIYRILKNEK